MIARFVLGAHPEARQRAADYIAHKAPDGFEVIVRKPKRNSDANAALHAAITEAAEKMDWTWCGQRYDLDAFKRLFVAAWQRATGRSMRVAPALDGNGIDLIYAPTSQMSQSEVAELITYVEAWSA